MRTTFIFMLVNISKSVLVSVLKQCYTGDVRIVGAG